MTQHSVPLPARRIGRIDGGEPSVASKPPRRRRRRRLISPLTRRILTINMLALVIPVGGLLYLGEYRENLVQTQLIGLRTQARIFAEALGEGAVGTAVDGTQSLRAEVARPMLRRLVQPTRTRARLFSATGELVADSRFLIGPGGTVQIEILPPPNQGGPVSGFVLDLYETSVAWLPGRRLLPRYRENPIQTAADYAEVMDALNGEPAGTVRQMGETEMVLSAAVPMQRFKRIMGALLLTASGNAIDRAVREVRLDVLRAFAIALAVTVLLSFYLAGTIARPVLRLATAADRVRRGQSPDGRLPDLSSRHDEIGDLSGALHDMTEALAQRMNAIESFAADVAHEIKNPLTSLRSAVETAARVSDPDQQRQLMAIIQEDVQRLDRLITDISDASRLDAELARGDMERVDLGRLLEAVVEVYRSTETPDKPRMNVKIHSHASLVVNGIEGRLVQVFRNLISNAISFSPPGGEIEIDARRSAGGVEFTVEDSGPGIPDESLDKIFERFYSERPEGEQFGEHSGLGLSISRQIIEAHNGTMDATNRRNGLGAVIGARFTVRLPAGDDIRLR